MKFQCSARLASTSGTLKSVTYWPTWVLNVEVGASSGQTSRPTNSRPSTSRKNVSERSSSLTCTILLKKWGEVANRQPPGQGFRGPWRGERHELSIGAKSCQSDLGLGPLRCP